jgi:hypothetical protein
MTLSDFLVWLGGVGVVGVISWIFEDWAWFQALVGKTKQLVFFVACAVVAVGAHLIVTYVSPAILASVAPYFAILAALFSYVFLGTDFHNKTRL